MEAQNIGAQLLEFLNEQEKTFTDKDSHDFKFIQIFREILMMVRQCAVDQNPIHMTKQLAELIKLFEVTSNNEKQVDQTLRNQGYKYLYEGVLDLIKNSNDTHHKIVGELALKNAILNKLDLSFYDQIVELNLSLLVNHENKLRELSCEILAIQMQEIVKSEQDFENFDKKGKVVELFNIIKEKVDTLFVKGDEEQINLKKKIQDHELNDYLHKTEKEIQGQKHIDVNIYEYDTKANTYVESFLLLLLGLIRTDVCPFFMNFDKQEESKENSSDIQVKDFENLVIDILSRSLNHCQKFIRETGLKIVQGIIEKQKKLQVSFVTVEQSLLEKFRNFIIVGLSDNYTNVRVQAIKTAFTFIEFVQKKTDLITEMLPYICFNRHHPAEGLHSYARQQFAEVFQAAGRKLMADSIEQSIEYYFKECFNRNYEIRNAAAICFNELITRIATIDEETMQKYYKHINNIALALVNGIFFEVNSIVREESLKTLQNLLQDRSKISKQSILDLIETCCYFHLPDQSAEVKQICSAIIYMLNSGTEEKLKKLKEKLFYELESITDKEKIDKELQNVEKYVKNISKEKLVQRHMADFLEGFSFMARVIAIAEKQDIEQAEKIVQTIMENVRKMDIAHVENIFVHVIQIVDSIIQALDKKGTKNCIQHIVEPLFKCAKYKTESGQSILLQGVNELFTNIAKKIGYQILKGRIAQHDLGQYESQFDILTINVPH